MQHLPAQEKDRHNNEEGVTSREQRTAECLIDTVVDHLSKSLPPLTTHVFTNAVKNNNGVIEGIPNDGQEGSDNLQIKLLVEQREKTNGDKDIMINGDDGSQSVAQVEHQSKNSRDDQGNDNQYW